MTVPSVPELVGIGYERRDLSEVVAMLQEHGVGTVVDVRATARSRRPDFAGSRLSAGLGAADVTYVHLRELGNPRDNRDGVLARAPDALARYESVLVGDDGRAAVARIVALAHDAPVALLCYERDGSTCHRRMVLAAARALDPSLEITALGDLAARRPARP